jgi:hypothetical protein
MMEMFEMDDAAHVSDNLYKHQPGGGHDVSWKSMDAAARHRRYNSKNSGTYRLVSSTAAPLGTVTARTTNVQQQPYRYLPYVITIVC